MAIPEADYIWMDGEFVPWADAKIHVLTHALHFGSSFFEGIRAYDTPSGTQIFRLKPHLERLYDTAKIYNCTVPYNIETLSKVCLDVISKNNLKSAYIRPLIFYGYGDMGVAPADNPVQTIVAAFSWGEYLGDGAVKNGVDVCVSSWNRVAPNTIPAAAKAGGNYLSGMLITQEAKARGFAEGIGLDVNGLVSEGSGQNIFLVRDGKLFTPPASASILQGITRASVITLAKDEGLEIVEQALPREALYLADEVFFTGTAVEITPVRSIDGRVVRSNGRGPITERLQERFFGLFSGQTPDTHGWLTPVAP